MGALNVIFVFGKEEIDLDGETNKVYLQRREWDAYCI
jgi:hypothetical protein